MCAPGSVAELGGLLDGEHRLVLDRDRDDTEFLESGQKLPAGEGHDTVLKRLVRL